MLSSRHIIDMSDLTTDDIMLILDTAESFKEVNERRIKKLPTLRGRTVVNLFLEPSTRTRTSFELAAKRLSADGINFSASHQRDGEGRVARRHRRDPLGDGVRPRHRAAQVRGLARACSPSTWTRTSSTAATACTSTPRRRCSTCSRCVRSSGKLEGLKVGIVGDICHSRVAGSLIPALKMVGATPIVIAPPTLLPARPDILGAEVATSFDEVLPELDVAYMLRIQMERAEGMPFPSVREYATLYGMNERRLAKMKPHAIVMHPGPMNRGVEITSAVADSIRSIDPRPGQCGCRGAHGRDVPAARR